MSLPTYTLRFSPTYGGPLTAHTCWPKMCCIRLVIVLFTGSWFLCEMVALSVMTKPQMEEELGMSSRDIKSLELELEQSRLQISAKDKEIRRERQTVEDLRTELRNIKTGLDRSSRYIQEPKELKEAVKELYRKHLDDFKSVRTHTSYTSSVTGTNCMEMCTTVAC